MSKKKVSCAINFSKNNCHTCKHLDYYHKESHEDFSEEGYFCNGREYKTASQEDLHLEKLQNMIYRARVKKCCERKCD